MKYRGVENRLLQAIAPRGWTWSFETKAGEKRGHSSKRAEAIDQAQRTIERYLKGRVSERRASWKNEHAVAVHRSEADWLVLSRSNRQRRQTTEIPPDRESTVGADGVDA